MKRFIILLSVVLASACTYNDSPLESTIFGTWDWVKTTGGFVNQTTTPASVGYSYTMILSPDFSFLSLRNDSPVNRGIFKFTKMYGQTAIDFNNGVMLGVFQHSSAELGLIDYNPEGSYSYYARR